MKQIILSTADNLSEGSHSFDKIQIRIKMVRQEGNIVFYFAGTLSECVNKNRLLFIEIIPMNQIPIRARPP